MDSSNIHNELIGGALSAEEPWSQPSFAASSEAPGDEEPWVGKTFGRRYPWLIEAARDPVDLTIFHDPRTRNAVRRARVRTWGDLADMTDDSLARLPAVGALTVRRIDEALAAAAHRPRVAARSHAVGGDGQPHSAGATGPGAVASREGQTSNGAGPWTARTFGQRYGWLLDSTEAPVDLSLFDTRSQTAFRRGNIRSWGDLAAHTDESLGAIPSVGSLTIRRINEVLGSYRPARPHWSHPADGQGPEGDSVPTADAPGDHRPTSAVLGLVNAAVWLKVVHEKSTVGELLEAYHNGAGLPPKVVAEVEGFLGLSLPTPSELPTLGHLIDKLVAAAGDPELFLARECSREQPTLASLGSKRGVTRERVRQKVVRDAKAIRADLQRSHYEPLRWAVSSLQAELGPVAPISSRIIETWLRQLGEQRFEVLRWLAGYTYNGSWLARGREAVATLTSALEQATGDAWLVREQDLKVRLGGTLAVDTALDFLLASGEWRDIGDGWLVRWDGPIQDKAERVLRLTGTPMTPAEIIEAIGSGSEGSLKNQRGSRLVRIDKHFRLALPEWGYEEYGGIANEIDQRIERGNGSASIKEIITEFVRDFRVSEASVRTYLESGPYVITGDEVRRLGDHAYTPANVLGRRHAVQVGGAWGQRFVVAPANLKGYSFGLDRDIAAHNGIQPNDSLLVPAMNSDSVVGEASIIWRLTNLNGTVDVGRLSSVLKAMEIGEGDEIILVPTPECCTIFKPKELPIGEARSTISSEVRQTILGRR